MQSLFLFVMGLLTMSPVPVEAQTLAPVPTVRMRFEQPFVGGSDVRLHLGAAAWQLSQGPYTRLIVQNQTGIYAERAGQCYQFQKSSKRWQIQTASENCQRQKRRSPQGPILELETIELDKPPGQSYTVAYDYLWLKDARTGALLKQEALSDAYNQLVGFNHAGHVLLDRQWSRDLKQWHTYPDMIATEGTIARIADVVRLPNKRLALATPRGVYVSNDALTQTKLWGLPDQDVQQLAVFANGAVLALSEQRIYSSAHNWKQLILPHSVEVEGLGVMGKHLVLKTAHLLLHSDNQGKTWRSHPLPPQAQSWLIDQTQIWIETPQGPFVSANFGATWQRQAQGLETPVPKAGNALSVFAWLDTHSDRHLRHHLRPHT
jgi:hypothetical protein